MNKTKSLPNIISEPINITQTLMIEPLQSSIRM